MNREQISYSLPLWKIPQVHPERTNFLEFHRFSPENLKFETLQTVQLKRVKIEMRNI